MSPSSRRSNAASTSSAPGRQAFLWAEVDAKTRAVDDAAPTVFVSGQKEEIAWTPDEANRDYLGNEFLLWRWFHVENESDTIKLSDDSEVAVMLARTLVLECPRGQYGRESITSDGPAKLPEALQALQAGRLPRKVGLTLHRHDNLYELTLQALAISGARVAAVRRRPTAADSRSEPHRSLRCICSKRSTFFVQRF